MEDARITATRTHIYEAMGRLLEEKPIRKITVTEICKMAGVNRATFYRHYIDPEDLANTMQKEAVDKLVQAVSVIQTGDNVEEILTLILRTIRTSTVVKMMRTQEDSGSVYVLMNQLSKACYDNYLSNYIRLHPEYAENKDVQQSVYAYLTSGATGVMVWWILTGMKEPEDKVAHRLYVLISTTVQMDV